MLLDASYFPHIFDQIIQDLLGEIDDEGVRRLRRTSRKVNRLAERELYRRRMAHLVITRPAQEESRQGINQALLRPIQYLEIYDLKAHPYGHDAEMARLRHMPKILPDTRVVSYRNVEHCLVDVLLVGSRLVLHQLPPARLPAVQVSRVLPPIVDWTCMFPIQCETVVVMTTMIRPPDKPHWKQHRALIPDISATCPRMVINVLLDTPNAGRWVHEGLIHKLRMSRATRKHIRHLVVVFTVSHTPPVVPGPTVRRTHRLSRPRRLDVSHGILDLFLLSLAAFLWRTRLAAPKVSFVGLSELLDTFPPAILGLADSQTTRRSAVAARINNTLEMLLARRQVKKAKDAVDAMSLWDGKAVRRIVDRVRFLSREEYLSEVGEWQFQQETVE